MIDGSGTSETSVERESRHGSIQFPMQLADGLWAVGNYYFNVYVVKGEQAAALIEVGVSASVDETVRQLEALRVAPSFLVVTHPHADHLTGLDGLRERYRDALVVVGKGAGEFLSHPKAGEAIVSEDRHMSKFLASVGIEPGRRPVNSAPALLESLAASDGDEMDLGGVTLRFLVVEGHSPGNVSVYIPELEALMPSDSLGFRFARSGFYPIFFTGFSEYVETLDRLAALKPRILCVPHQGPRVGHEVEEAFRQARAAAFEIRDRIRNDPRDAEAVAVELFQDCYKDEFLLYSPENILGCIKLLVKRSRD